MKMIGREEVARRLTYERCIPIVREAMIAFSRGETQQLLRSILPLGDGRMFGVMPGVMPGAMAGHGVFGAKLISVFPPRPGAESAYRSHQGVVILFDAATGAPICVADAGEITAIRTAAASAVATDALARPEAARLALFGTGEQAATHARAITWVRRIERIVVWGRRPERARALAAALAAELGIPAAAVVRGEEAARHAEILCTVTAAREPVLLGRWVQPGTHVNLVGSGCAGPVEADEDLVARSRFIVDSREGVRAQGAEFLRAKAAGRVGDEHIAAEIGEVLAGTAPGRRAADEVTVYKSLGHIVQDLASAWALCRDEP